MPHRRCIGINREGQRRQVLAVKLANRENWLESKIGETLTFYRLPRAPACG